MEALITSMSYDGKLRVTSVNLGTVSVFNTALALQMHLERSQSGCLVCAELPARCPGILLTLTQEDADVFNTVVRGKHAVPLLAPPLCSGPACSYDLAVFPGRGAAYNRAGLVLRHGRAFDNVDDLDAADKAAPYPRSAMSVGFTRFCVRADMLNIEDALIARRCFYTNRRFVEVAKTVFVRLPALQR